MRLARLAAAGAFVLGGCASVDIPPREAPQPPKNYQALLLAKSAALIPGVPLGEMEVSTLRDDQHVEGAFWSACLRTDARGKRPRLFAVFFGGEYVVHVREALAVDRCARESFLALRP